MNEEDLLTVLGNVSHTDMFSSRSYWKWENEIATPRLEELGYRVIRWFSTDSDSFGPLVRAVEVERNGQKQLLTYG